LLTKDWAEDIGLYHGSVWFRKTVELTKDMAGKPGRLWLGRITDSDIAYVNGEVAGRTEYKYPPRVYPLREGLLREGANSIAVRVLCEGDGGGFCPGKDYMLELAGGTVPLDNEWAYMPAYKTGPLEPSVNIFSYPCGLYNGMLAPVLPFSISAFLWYQGESNDQSPRDYAWLLSRFLTDIRDKCGENLPFLLVQLPNYDAGELNANWAMIMEHQSTILNYHRTSMIVTTDIGEDNDLHPLNKRDVGRRLASETLKLIDRDNLTIHN
jgi:sialate O-acetylesterase